MTDLVRVKDKYQVTLPVALREQLAVKEGDYLEVTVRDDGLLLRPQRLTPSATAAHKRATKLLAFLRQTPTKTRTRKSIDATLLADRATWDQ